MRGQWLQCSVGGGSSKSSEGQEVMEMSAHVAGLERKRADFLQEAAELVRSATAVGREITAEEDLHVMELTKNAHIIEEELHRFRRHHDEGRLES